MAIVTYPLNDIEYSAEDAELFHVTRTSGIYASNSFDYSISGADNSITIGAGIAWIKNSEFSGKVVAQKDETQVDLGIADSLYDRIDAIVLQFSANNNATNIIVKHGEPSASPVFPSVIRSEAIYELHLYHVNRKAGAVTIAPSDITDLRLNDTYCGIMADSVTSVNTDAIEAQITSLIERLEDEISGIEDGSEFLLRSGGAPMTGNLQMGANKITDLAEPAESTDAVNLQYATDHFAPSGYGYGGNAIYLGILNSESEFEQALDLLYAEMQNLETKLISVAGLGYSDWRWFGIVSKSSASYGTCVLHSAYTQGSHIQKTRYGGTWKPLEWFNPPMSASVVYRTTERCGGKAVYAINLSFAAESFSEGSSMKYAFSNKGINHISEIANVDAKMISGSKCGPLPSANGDGGLVITWEVTTGDDPMFAVICKQSDGVVANVSVEAIVKFTID